MNGKIKVFPVLLSRLGSDHLFADGSWLPMGCLTSYLRFHQNGKLISSFDIERLVNRTREHWQYYLDQANKYHNESTIWLFSNYVWNISDNIEIAKEIKKRSPNSLIIMGGPHIPAYLEESNAFFADHPFVDITVRGEGESALAEIFEVILSRQGILPGDFSAVTGITFRHQEQIVRTTDRTRSKDLSTFPSPFITGEFDDASFNNLPYMILETNRGCPYGCTYCDWGAATLQKVRHFDLERVMQDIDIIGSKKAYILHIADANFGAFARDIEIAKAIVEARKKYGFPKKFSSSNAKNASPIIGEVIKILTEGGLVTQGAVAIQSVDEEVLEAVNRSNIKTANFEKLMRIFKDEQLLLTSELLIGLPGQTYLSHKNDLQYVFERKITSQGYHVQMMPNAPMNEPSYRKKYDIQTDKNGFVISTSTFTTDELQKMQTLFLAFQFFYALGVTKYFLYYLQIECNIKALDFIDAILSINVPEATQYPLIERTIHEVLHLTSPRNIGVMQLHWKTDDVRFLFDNLDTFYDEIFRFAHEKFHAEIPPGDQETLKAAHMGIMPILGKKVPQNIYLQHDFVNYFNQIKNMDIVTTRPALFKPLRNFPSGSMTVQALQPKTIDSLTLVISDTKTGLGWELRSPLRFVKPRINKIATDKEVLGS